MNMKEDIKLEAEKDQIQDLGTLRVQAKPQRVSLKRRFSNSWEIHSQELIPLPKSYSHTYMEEQKNKSQTGMILKIFLIRKVKSQNILIRKTKSWQCP